MVLPFVPVIPIQFKSRIGSLYIRAAMRPAISRGFVTTKTGNPGTSSDI